VPYGSYSDLVADPNVDIVYIASPHSHHYQHARLALEAGKHVLCEKAFTVNAKQTQILIDIAREKKVFLMEAVWTRFLPLAKEIREVVASGKIGEVKRVWADLSYWKDVEGEFASGHRMVDLGLAGGALLDCEFGSSVLFFALHTLPAPFAYIYYSLVWRKSLTEGR
jgi:predicted dehydrogenase